ncbi:DUF2254 domain-containing protein [Bizionia argentinensis JUB59]|uniref:DUF2254 domain-containing protein n=1 Tax=Bizionia argentinensis JUB59 TaxID=1046627 RepID=G2EHK4_9FLAO|nr:DUF2254 domain-containing protein [Bizionia argentinensis]EGV42100.1 DUF2254 domain-containing protein [Bizionia argentinensis JUB59]
MKSLYNRFISFINTIRGKIAFYPTLFSFVGFNFAMLMLYLEKEGISAFVIEHVPQLVINNADTAKTLLSFLTGGIISIMVFSFSMVMVLLNQASSNFSPRVLPGLISNRNHQFVLGIYLATILYNTFTLVGINPQETDKYQLPGFSVLIGIVLTVICLGAFLYFIHSISQSIQVNNILDSIYKKAKKRLDQLIEKESENVPDFPDTSNWISYHSSETGYFQNIAKSNLIDICEKENIQLKILVIQGVFVLEGIPIIQVSKEIDEELVKDILSNFNFSRGEFVEDNYTLAFKQITEIGMKAMSPGINDPGTAISTIDYLTELFALRLKKNDRTIFTSDDNERSLIAVTTIDFKELLYQVMVSYRTYCKHDLSCIQKLFIMFKYLLLQQAHLPEYQDALQAEAKLLYEDSQTTIQNATDLRRIEKLYQSLPNVRN